MKKTKLFINDFILIMIIILLCVLSSAAIYGNNENNAATSITIMVGNDIYGKYNLNTDCSVEIEDTGVVCTIQDGKAHISHSDCPDKSCMRSPAITGNSVSGASIVCLPNLVSIIKDSSKSDIKGVDVIAS